ncbi:GNAT family N-acetyltransferase [Cupriavidus basilensis]|uniref:GNAT family N-acetyltransferase n=1 Tax=Cupriavidus basilensis TaxID=68895 RepID=A0ABT6B0I2_9BURK|nr:GNAT family N-acetyltransferase [Cupriavidus basilensis]MDF3838387.1 GNAT family N-acetyltransferase [Cupriavidus basilensis]
MTNTIFRLARHDDLDALLRLYRELRPGDPDFDGSPAALALAQVLGSEAVRLVVAECENQLVATCMLAVIPSLPLQGRPIGLLEHVVTAAAWRGRGIGLAMLRHVLALAWQAGCCKAMLLSGAQRDDAHRLYLAAGFDGDRERGFVVKAPAAA